MVDKSNPEAPVKGTKGFQEHVHDLGLPAGAVFLIAVVVVILGLVLCWPVARLLGGTGTEGVTPSSLGDKKDEEGIQCDWLADAPTGLDDDRGPTNAFHMGQEIILTGPGYAIESLIAELSGDPALDEGAVTLRPIESCSIQETGHLQSMQEMNLYAMDPNISVADVLEAVSRSPYSNTVTADPNYLVGLLGTSACGSPHGVRPSGFETVADPHGVRPSPIGDAPGVPGEEDPASPKAAAMFQNQWAFAQLGLSPADLKSFHAPDNPASGYGVRVGVLDTSPFAETGPSSKEVAAPTEFPTVELSTEHGVTPPWELEVVFPNMPTLEATLASSSPGEALEEPEEAKEPLDLSDHGLFVAGLIHALAPESQIQLIRVLDEQGCGDLYTLNKAIYDFALRVDQNRSKLDGAVINLSLGVQKPRQGDKPDKPKKDPEAETPSQEAPKLTETRTATETLNILINDSVESLQQVVEDAVAKGVVVVAAAGNDSYPEKVPLSPHLPAAYPQVIGVSGTNLGRQRSCFSNWGDVAAPAGDGLPGVDENMNKYSCWPVLEDCRGDCPIALISLVDKVAKGYAYWTGTSFATPLTSGLSAMVLDKGASGANWVVPADVFDAVRCGAPTPDGVINVPATLGRCMP